MMTVNLRALIGKLNETTRIALESAAGLCLSRTHYDIEWEHLIVKLLEGSENDFGCILSHFSLDRARLAKDIDRSLDRLKAGNARTPAFSPSLMHAFTGAWVYGSLELDAARIRSGFFVVSLLAQEELERIVREVSPEMMKISVDTLRRDFLNIVAASVEGAEEPAPAVAQLTSTPVTGGPRVFISYRRGDGDFYADSLFDRMMAGVSDVAIFRDTDTLKPGMVYSEKIDQTLRTCDFLLVVMGKKWLNAVDKEGVRRLEKSDDWVRLEIAAALRHGTTVVPCLIGGAAMPAQGDLPQEIADLTLRHAVSLSQKAFRRDTDALIDMLKSWRRAPASAQP
jgi:hypothetical protein